MQNQPFEEIQRFESSFYRIEVQVITNPSSRLEKHQSLDFVLMTDFYDLLKKISISAFSDIFEDHRLHTLKSLHVFYLM